MSASLNDPRPHSSWSPRRMEMWESGLAQSRAQAEACSPALIAIAEARAIDDAWWAGWLAGAKERLQAPAVDGVMTGRHPEMALSMAFIEMDEQISELCSSFAAIRAAHERLGSVDRTLDHEIIHALAEAVWSVRVHSEDVASLLDSLVATTDGVVA